MGEHQSGAEPRPLAGARPQIAAHENGAWIWRQPGLPSRTWQGFCGGLVAALGAGRGCRARHGKAIVQAACLVMAVHGGASAGLWHRGWTGFHDS